MDLKERVHKLVNELSKKQLESILHAYGSHLLIKYTDAPTYFSSASLAVDDTDYLSLLPDEILLPILKMTQDDELKRLCLTNKKFFDLCKDREIFSRIFVYSNRLSVDTNLPTKTNVKFGLNAGGYISFDGRLWVWGNNKDGKLGTGKKKRKNVRIPLQVDLPEPVKFLRMGEYFTAVIGRSGKVYVAGKGTFGRFGESDLKKSSTFIPLVIDPITILKATQVEFVGSQNLYILTEDGKVRTWTSRTLETSSYKIPGRVVKMEGGMLLTEYGTVFFRRYQKDIEIFYGNEEDPAIEIAVDRPNGEIYGLIKSSGLVHLYHSRIYYNPMIFSTFDFADFRPVLMAITDHSMALVSESGNIIYINTLRYRLGKEIVKLPAEEIIEIGNVDSAYRHIVDIKLRSLDLERDERERGDRLYVVLENGNVHYAEIPPYLKSEDSINLKPWIDERGTAYHLEGKTFSLV